MSDQRMKFYKEESTKNYYASGTISDHQIGIGALMRIADSLEKIARSNPFSSLQYYREQYEGLYKQNKRQ